MITSFVNRGSVDIAEGRSSKAARALLPPELWQNAHAKLVLLDNARSLNDIASTPGYHFEKLSGQRKGQYSIRINRQYRICFSWSGQDASDVEIVDYHR